MANEEPQSPSLTSKLKTRSTVNKMKHGSPKIQEVLRQRCRERMKEKREQFFNKKRQGIMEIDENLQETLTEIVRHEFSQLATIDENGKNILLDSDLGESISQDEALEFENEFLLEEEQWILQEYEKLLEDDAAAWAVFAEESLKTDVMCPLCEKGTISDVLNFLCCSACNFRMPLRASVKDFGKMVQDSVATHSSNCSGIPSFMLMPENNTDYLSLMCDNCSIFTTIL